MDLLALFGEKYNDIKVSGFDSKFLPYQILKNYLDEKFSEKELIGNSFLGNDIYLMKLGTGKLKILAWSQMHGNEATGTRAMLDVWEFLQLNESIPVWILNQITFYFIPMLNPDGANLYTRRNAVGIDINRDFNQESSPEIKVLKYAVSQIEPDFLFNLHDQRSIFNVGNTPEPATLAFLSPSADENRTITDSRISSMAVIDSIYKGLAYVIPNKIARFSDEFYPSSTGDNFIKAEIPAILFEAGHFPGDYDRNQVRKWNAFAILLGLEKIAKEEKAEIGCYMEIPENNKKFLDIILRNVLVKSSFSESLLDIGIYFEEKLNHETKEIEYWSKIEEIGDLSNYFGHLDIDKKGKFFIGKTDLFPRIGDYADFQVGSIHFEKGKFKG